MLLKKRPLTKLSRVVCQNSRSTSSTTSDKVWQIIGQTLVCASLHLECWLDKPRVEIVTWAAVGVAHQQQFSYNSVSKFWQCEHNPCGFSLHLMPIFFHQFILFSENFNVLVRLLFDGLAILNDLSYHHQQQHSQFWFSIPLQVHQRQNPREKPTLSVAVTALKCQ